MEMKLEVIGIPVSDVDAAKEFYVGRIGFNLDHDVRPGNGMRVVQLTPPGSQCSIVIGTGVGEDMAPGSLKGLQLVVNDVRAARAELAARGVDVTEVQFFGRDGSIRAARPDDDLNNVGFCHFTDPDGTGWSVQQITARP